MNTIKHLQEVRELIETGNTYLKVYTTFYAIWNLITMILLIIVIFGIGALLFQTNGLLASLGLGIY